MVAGAISPADVVRGLFDIGGVLASRDPLDDRIERVLARLAVVVGSDRCSIMRWEGGRYHGAYRVGYPREIAGVFDTYSFGPDVLLVSEARDAGGFLVVTDAPHHPEFGVMATVGRIQSVAMAVMDDPDGEPIGVLAAEYCERPLSDTTLLAEVVGGTALLISGVILADRERARRREAERARQRMLDRVSDAEDRERQRISHDIHDDVLQRVSAIAHFLEVAADETGDGELTKRLRWLHEEARSSAILLRRLVSDLHPVPAKQGTLRSTLQGLADVAAERTGVPVEVTVVGEERPPDAVVVAVHRIIRQAVDNAAAHAAPSRIDVSVDVGEDRTRLVVMDDGCGFDPVVAESRGIGLFSMRERARQLGGRWGVTSQPGHGTVVEASIPHRAPSEG